VTALIESAPTPSVDDVAIRTAREADIPALLELHGRCSADSLRFRYLSAYVPDQQTLMAMLARTNTLIAWHDDRAVAMGNLSVSSDVAELALLVEDEWHGRGVGRRLGDLLTAVALDLGASSMCATTAGANRRVHELMGQIGVSMDVEYVSGTAYVTCELPSAGRQPNQPRPSR
jgi:N-acetylglutamate synthase-like GNAT family acetyltransferase